MWQVMAILVVCVMVVGVAHAQTPNPQFWVLTDRGNVFLIEGPPPPRPPGFDTAPNINVEGVNTILSLTADGAPGVDPVAIMGDAGVVTPLPAYHPDRPNMRAAIVTDWSGTSQPLYVNMPVGTLMRDDRNFSPPKIYMGPARANAASLDLLQHCNTGPAEPDGNGTAYGNITVACVDNYQGRNITQTSWPTTPISPTRYNGYVMDLQPNGRTIIHVDYRPDQSNPSPPPLFAEVMFTCPGCMSDARAYHGVGGGAFLQFGFALTASTSVPVPTVPSPYSFDPVVGLRDLAWGQTGPHASPPLAAGDPNRNINYWQDGGSCSPGMSISGGNILGACYLNPDAGDIQAGTVRATTWKPLAPGWNMVEFPTGPSYIIITNPGPEAKLQIRMATGPTCCTGFDGNLYHRAFQADNAGRAKAAVIHDVDRHLLIIPHGGVAPNTKPEDPLSKMQDLRQQVAEQPRTTPRWLAHSDQPAPGRPDPIYNGMFSGESPRWPPYHVRLVEARSINFDIPPISLNQDVFAFAYSQRDLQNVVALMRTTQNDGLMNSEIYDIRNDKFLRTYQGEHKRWDGTTYDRPFIQPWLNLQKNPVWEIYGIPLPEDEFVIVDTYATIPIVKPTHMSDVYLSSLSCGLPDPDEVAGSPSDPTLHGPLIDGTFRAVRVGGYDPALVDFLLHADGGGDITDNLLLQHIYHASRTYLDYLDGTYLAGDFVHVPILPNRPFLCVIVAPNILESMYNLGALPFGNSYLQLGGHEGSAVTAGEINSTWAASYAYQTGIQSPRTGVVAMDVQARLGASVSAFGMGDAGNHNDFNMTTQWINGTILVDADMTVGETTVTLTRFSIDTYQIADRGYDVEGDTCYARFSTHVDNSDYITRTITTAAKLGEHIPVVVNLTAYVDGPTGSSGPTTYNPPPSVPAMTVRDGGAHPPVTSSDTLTVGDSGRVGTVKLTLDIDDGAAWRAVNQANGGTDVVLVSPSGTEITMPSETGRPTLQGSLGYRYTTHVYDISAFAGEEMFGTWELRMVDHGAQDATFGPYLGTPTANYWHYDFDINSWEIEITQTAAMTVDDICDGTTYESVLVQFMLNTFAVDVR